MKMIEFEFEFEFEFEMWKAMYRPLGWLSHAPCRQGGCPDAADGSLLNGMKANISEADVSLNAVHVAQGSAAGRPPSQHSLFFKAPRRPGLPGAADGSP